MEREHRWLVPRPVPGARARPIIARLLNYHDHDAVLRRSQELQTLCYEGTELSTFSDFTPHVQEMRRLFLPAKQKLQELKLECAMLYPAQLREYVDGKTKIFSDPTNLQQYLKQSKSESGGQRSPRLDNDEPAASQDLEKQD